MHRRTFRIRTAALALLAVLPVTGGEAPERLRIYIAVDDHTDYMWSADAATYQSAFVEMLDYYLDRADATEGARPAYQSRFCCDGSFWFWTYEQRKSPAEVLRLVRRIKDGHITVPLTPLVLVYGGMPAEAVLRSMYYAGTIERRYDMRLPFAHINENQTAPYGLGSLFAGAGARYCWNGICSCATRVPGRARTKRQHEIYWWTGRDGSRLLMKWYSLWGGNAGPGGYAEARKPASAIDFVSTNAAFRKRHPYKIIGLFGKGWDDLKTLTDEFEIVATAKTDAARQVIVSNEIDFFRDFEATYGSSLPAFSASFGNEWDLLTASLVEVTAAVRRATEKLRSAEALATLVMQKDPRFLAGREAARARAYLNLGLYFEHDWTADGRVGRDDRGAWQRTIAQGVTSYVDRLYDDAVAALGRLIRRSGGSPRFFVFNPLSWRRTDVADIPYTGSGPVHVVDLTTGEETPSQLFSRDGSRSLRVLASDLPSVGYRVYEIRSGAGTTFPEAVKSAGRVIENRSYRITVSDRGAVTSLVDKRRGMREFAAEIGSRAVNDLGPGSGTVEIENVGPVSVTLKATGQKPLRHVTRVTLIRDCDRIEIRNQITQGFAHPAVWTFSFNLTDPDLWHEEVGAVIRARLLADGGHYSPINARYDWLTLNHFADMTGREGGITLSSHDLSFMRLGGSTTADLDTETPQIGVLAGGQVDGTRLGIRYQGGYGRFLQRFALRTHGDYDEAAAMRFALEHQNPPVAGMVTGGTHYPDTTYSFLSIDARDVLLWALKPAEDGAGAGTVVRLWNLGSTKTAFKLARSDGPLAAATHVTHLETPVGSAAVREGFLTESIEAHQIKTFQFVP